MQSSLTVTIDHGETGLRCGSGFMATHLYSDADHVELRINGAGILELPDEVEEGIIFMDVISVSRKGGVLTIVKPQLTWEDALSDRKPRKGFSPMRHFDGLVGSTVKRSRLQLAEKACVAVEDLDRCSQKACAIFLHEPTVDLIAYKLSEYVRSTTAGQT